MFSGKIFISSALILVAASAQAASDGLHVLSYDVAGMRVLEVSGPFAESQLSDFPQIAEMEDPNQVSVADNRNRLRSVSGANGPQNLIIPYLDPSDLRYLKVYRDNKQLDFTFEGRSAELIWASIFNQEHIDNDAKWKSSSSNLVSCYESDIVSLFCSFTLFVKS